MAFLGLLNMGEQDDIILSDSCPLVLIARGATRSSVDKVLHRCGTASVLIPEEPIAGDTCNLIRALQISEQHAAHS